MAISVAFSAPSAAGATPPAGAGAATDSTYVVVDGDCLWHIAQAHYGDGARWTAIYEANRDTIKNLGLIYTGQTLLLPAA